MGTEIKFEPFDPLEEVEKDISSLMVKSQIRNLFDSYNGEFDLLIELLQNAVDALEEAFSKKVSKEIPEIDVFIDLQKNIIRISDNGIGIDHDLAKKILAPNFTNKTFLFTKSKKRLRGHKGVGLTYIAYSSNSLKYCSKTEKGIFSGEINNAKNWVLDENNTIPTPLVQPSEYFPKFLKEHNRGSSFEVSIDSSQLPKTLKWEGWEYVLRTQTAVAYFNLNEIKEWAKRTKINLTVIDRNGEELKPSNGSNEVDFGFLYPHLVLRNSLSLQKYFEKYKYKASPPIQEKNKYDCIYNFWDNEKLLKEFFSKEEENDKYLFAKEKKAAIYAVFTHSANLWKEMDKLLTDDRRRKFWRPGIQIITESMPTGRQFEVSLAFTAGNKDRIFILISLDNIRPDYGRKTFHTEVFDFSQYMARKLVELFVQNRELLKPTERAHGITEAERELTAELRIENAKKLPDLDIPKISFEKEPQYEQDVVALFHELIGREILKGYKILSVSSGAQYDAVVRYYLTKDERVLFDEKINPLGLVESAFGKNKKIELLPKNMEFKYVLSDLIKEIEGDIKNFEDIKFCTVWDIGDPKIFKRTGYQLINLSENESKRIFYGTTHLLYSGSNKKPIHIICLKSIRDILRK